MTDWEELSEITQGGALSIERVRLENSNIMIEGNFSLPPLARLKNEDQIFVAAFVKAHGSIKQMEQLYGVSYPTVKNRLNNIASQLEFVTVQKRSSSLSVLDQLDNGEIGVDEALELLKSG